MTDPSEERIPQTQAAVGGRPPGPPKITARDLADQPPDPSGRRVFLPDPVVVRDLASALQLKTFRIVADLIELRLLKSPDDTVSFETAALIAKKHGYRAERPPPGVLVL